MIAIDTSSMIAFLDGSGGDDVAIVDAALLDQTAVFPPVVVSELLSQPGLDRSLVQAILDVPTLAVTSGYWERTGRLRAKVLARGHRARLADALIAQSCADARVPLITRDRDFRYFRRAAGLRLLP